MLPAAVAPPEAALPGAGPMRWLGTPRDRLDGGLVLKVCYIDNHTHTTHTTSGLPGHGARLGPSKAQIQLRRIRDVFIGILTATP